MSISRDKATGHWSYNFMYKGVRYHRRFKDASYDEVVGFEAIAKAELRKTGYDISENKVCALSEIVQDFKIYADNNYADPENAKRIIDIFYKLTANKPAEQVTINDLELYRTHRKNKVQAATINREMNNIKRMFSIARSNRKIRFNPCDDLKTLKIKNPTKRFLQKDEEKKLLKAANPIMKTIIIMALHTGMRLSEIRNLKWSDVFLSKNYLIALNTKNGRSRKLSQNSPYSFPRIKTYNRFKDE